MVPFIERLSGLMRTFGADRFSVAEVGGEQALAEDETVYRRQRPDSTLPMGFDFLSAARLSPALIRDTLSNWTGNDREGWPSWAFSNHDAPRVVTRWGDGRTNGDWAKLFLALLMSLRGNIFLYQGEELGLPQAHAYHLPTFAIPRR